MTMVMKLEKKMSRYRTKLKIWKRTNVRRKNIMTIIWKLGKTGFVNPMAFDISKHLIKSDLYET